MNRRDFLAASAAATGLAGLCEAAPADNQYFELCVYDINKDGDQAEKLSSFLKEEHLPMAKRLGAGHAGYFGLRPPPEQARAAASKRGTPLPEPGTRIVTVLAFDSWPAYGAALAAQRADRRWTSAVEALLGQPPAYNRVDSWLLRAFDGMPKIELPPSGRHLFDLRIAETPNLGAQARKIAMWNEGEIDTFRKVRLNPVLFGETVVGPRMPNFWFMVWYPGSEARDEAWAAFWKHPDWLRMSKDPRYQGASTKTNDFFLEPLSFSPIA